MPHNSMRQKGDMKQVSYWGPTNTGIRRHHTNFSLHGHLAPGICAIRSQLSLVQSPDYGILASRFHRAVHIEKRVILRYSISPSFLGPEGSRPPSWSTPPICSWIFLWYFPTQFFRPKLYMYRWFKYDRDYLCVNKSQFVPVIFEPPCTFILYLLHALPIPLPLALSPC
jgi:hypothetical protein